LAIDLNQTTSRSILTRTSGFLRSVTTHSLQPYRGCTYGNALCGVGCYVQHNRLLTHGQRWGSFLDVRENAADLYRSQVERERRWAERRGGAFSVFMSSSTDPYVPQERRYRLSRRILQAMLESPPDELVLQTHSHLILDDLSTLQALSQVCRLRVHISIESDQQDLPGLPPAACSIDRRFAAAHTLRQSGIFVVVTVSPLLPIVDADAFFARIASQADATVIDHFIGGDGSPDGRRTAATSLPQAMEQVIAGSTRLSYRDEVVDIARKHLPGRVGVSIDGFAGSYLPA